METINLNQLKRIIYNEYKKNIWKPCEKKIRNLYEHEYHNPNDNMIGLSITKENDENNGFLNIILHYPLYRHRIIKIKKINEKFVVFSKIAIEKQNYLLNTIDFNLTYDYMINKEINKWIEGELNYNNKIIPLYIYISKMNIIISDKKFYISSHSYLEYKMSKGKIFVYEDDLLTNIDSIKHDYFYRDYNFDDIDEKIIVLKEIINSGGEILDYINIKVDDLQSDLQQLIESSKEVENSKLKQKALSLFKK